MIGGTNKILEITSRHNELGTDVFYDEESTVKYMVFGSNQWISYDDEESFAAKKKFQSSLCLKGMMLWSLDLDDPSFGAMHALFGGENMADALGEIDLTGEEKEKLVDELAQYTGQNCYVAIGCASSSDDDSKNAQCGSGYKAVEMAHAPYKLTASQKGDLEKCDRGEYHYVCCPEKEMPQNCEWIGAPEQSEFGCSRTCGDSQFMLASDSYVDYKGEGSCYSGRRSVSSTDIQSLFGHLSLTFSLYSCAATLSISWAIAGGQTVAQLAATDVVMMGRTWLSTE